MTDFDRVRQAPAEPNGGGLTPPEQDHGEYSITPIMGTVQTPDSGSRELLFPGITGLGDAVPATPADLFAAALAAPLPADQNPYVVYRESFGNPDSARAMVGCLDRIAALFASRAGIPDPSGERFPWHLLRYQHTATIRAEIFRKDWAPAYRNKHLSALRMVLRFAWKLGHTTADEYHAAADLERDQGTRLPAGRSVAAAELDALLRVCVADPTPAGLRDAAVIACLYSTGCRRAELAAASRENYDIGSRTLVVIGKRDKQRKVYVAEDAAVHLGRWLAHDTRKTGPLIGKLHNTGRILDGHMTGESIQKILLRRGEQARIPKANPHDFRRTFIGDVLDSGSDLATAQELVGHASPTTTARYDRRPDRKRQEAVDRLRLPRPQDLT